MDHSYFKLKRTV